jgi:hypothetical protein
LKCKQHHDLQSLADRIDPLHARTADHQTLMSTIGQLKIILLGERRYVCKRAWRNIICGILVPTWQSYSATVFRPSVLSVGFGIGLSPVFGWHYFNLTWLPCKFLLFNAGFDILTPWRQDFRQRGL